jgi:hypothetical protein
MGIQARMASSQKNEARQPPRSRETLSKLQKLLGLGHIFPVSDGAELSTWSLTRIC